MMQRTAACVLFVCVLQATAVPLADLVEDASQAVLQTEWSASSPQPNQPPRPRLPSVDQTISNLRGVMDRLEMESVNSAAAHDAVESSYEAKIAQVKALLAVPEQALESRLSARDQCKHQVSALEELKSLVVEAETRKEAANALREEQSKHYSNMLDSARSLAQRNRNLVAEARKLLEAEAKDEGKIEGGAHFDPIALRQQQPDNILAHAIELLANADSLIEAKVAHQEEALSEIAKAFACKDCEESADRLQAVKKSVQSDLEKHVRTCDQMAEAHRPLDEADREKVMSLNKDLEEYEASRTALQKAEALLKEQRNDSTHVAQKMVGFYQSLMNPSK